MTMPDESTTSFAEVANVISAALSRFGLIVEGTNSGIKTGLGNRSAFNLHSNIADPSNPPTTKFRPQDVEPLLDQAIAILDKAIADRGRWASAGEKFANLQMDVFSSSRLVQISLAEEQDGRFDVDSTVS